MSYARSLTRDNRSLPIHREWRSPEPLDPCLVERLVREAPMLPEVAAVLLRRSGGDLDRARLIREPAETYLPEIIELPGIRDAALRIAEAIASNERIVAYSDFDADGVTSAAIVTEALEAAGAARVSVYLPSRFTEGYGFHASSVKNLASAGPCLFITSDCGITGVDGCGEAVRLGCDVIVTDHHLPGDRLPDAYSVLDPHIPSWKPFGLGDLTGAGVAYLLAQALFRTLGIEHRIPVSWAHDLLALSIAGDGHPVLGLNRAWATSGLKVLSERQRPGIASLLEVAGILQAGGDARPLSFDRDVTFGLVPRLNAAGRLRDARIAFDILVERDPARAKALALELNGLNQERRSIEEAMMEQCLADLESLAHDSYAVCISRPEWHEGVIGIAASKLREAYGRPAVLASGEGDLLKGSVRGIPGFNVVEALSRCADLLAGFGGHEAAGGFTVRRDAVGSFFDKFGSVSAELLSGIRISTPLDLDEVLPLGRVSSETLKGFCELEPFGRGNTIPQAAVLDCEVQQLSLLGKARDHLQLTLSEGGASRKFLWFGRGSEARDIALMGRVDVAFTPYRSVYLGEEQVTPLVTDIRPSWRRSGAGYTGLAEEAASDGVCVIYTWSPHAATSIWSALRKSGMAAAVHFEGQAGVRSHEARLILKNHNGAVVSTAPWELLGVKGANLAEKVVLAHLPISESHAERLEACLLGLPEPHRVHDAWEQDSLNWLSWTYPEKDSVGWVWKSLKKRSQGDRVRYSGLAGVCVEVSQDTECSPAFLGSPEGGRLLVERSLAILKELGMVEYVETRREPELMLCRGGERILLATSPSYLEGKEIREAALETWRGKYCSYLSDRRGG